MIGALPCGQWSVRLRDAGAFFFLLFTGKPSDFAVQHRLAHRSSSQRYQGRVALTGNPPPFRRARAVSGHQPRRKRGLRCAKTSPNSRMLPKGLSPIPFGEGACKVRGVPVEWGNESWGSCGYDRRRMPPVCGSGDAHASGWCGRSGPFERAAGPGTSAICRAAGAARTARRRHDLAPLHGRACRRGEDHAHDLPRRRHRRDHLRRCRPRAPLRRPDGRARSRSRRSTISPAASPRNTAPPATCCRAPSCRRRISGGAAR